MYRLRLRYRDGLAVEDGLPVLDDDAALRVLTLLFEVLIELSEAEVRASDGRLIAQLKRSGERAEDQDPTTARRVP